MTNHQGTEWESKIVRDAEETDSPYHKAGRYPKRGQADEPDVWIGSAEAPHAIPLVIWKRLTGKKQAGKPRQPDGERHVVVIGYNDFLMLLPHLPYTFDVQAKWTTNLNVTRTLAGLRRWIKENRR